MYDKRYTHEAVIPLRCSASAVVTDVPDVYHAAHVVIHACAHSYASHTTAHGLKQDRIWLVSECTSCQSDAISHGHEIVQVALH